MSISHRVNDHDELRTDALLTGVVGRTDPTGEDRIRERERKEDRNIIIPLNLDRYLFEWQNSWPAT